jgi:hypothetical protein
MQNIGGVEDPTVPGPLRCNGRIFLTCNYERFCTIGTAWRSTEIPAIVNVLMQPVQAHFTHLYFREGVAQATFSMSAAYETSGPGLRGSFRTQFANLISQRQSAREKE